LYILLNFFRYGFWRRAGWGLCCWLNRLVACLAWSRIFFATGSVIGVLKIVNLT
jgi:hypothetical protein